MGLSAECPFFGTLASPVNNRLAAQSSRSFVLCPSACLDLISMNLSSHKMDDGCFSNQNPLDLIQAHIIAAPVIELGGAG